ncbi:MAG: hypothetical protein PHE89_07495 [Alphaproteobacteria bacterium]|nr:hypothetical protein [Alphaproteobacteria bacterium]
MIRFILLCAIIGAGAYYAFDKIAQDKANEHNSVVEMNVNENSPAALRAVKAVVSEDYDYEKRAK